MALQVRHTKAIDASPDKQLYVCHSGGIGRTIIA